MPDHPTFDRAPSLDPNRTGSIADPAATTGSDAPPALTAPPPASAGRYEFGEEIARGGMGIIYRATDTTFGREVAVKVLQERFGPASGAARRFLEEARITGQLQHPAIPPAHDVGTLPDGRLFLAMKLIQGQTLDALLKASQSRVLASRSRERPESVPPAAHAAGSPNLISVFEQICQAVGYAHAHGVIHRDLKPANVMVGAFGEVQVMDWGLAKELASRGRERAEEESHESGPLAEEIEADPDRTTDHRAADGSTDERTRAGQAIGTPAYMPPEQARGEVERVDRRSDVFALGGILCTVLSGRPPFTGANAANVLKKAAAGDLGDAFDRLDACGADAELVALCQRCLDPDPARRPADGGEVAALVGTYRAEVERRLRASEQERAAAEATAAGERKRRRVVVIAAAAVVGVLLTGAGASAWQAVEAHIARRAAEAETVRANDAATAEGRARVAEGEAADLARKREGEAKASEARAVEREQEERKAKEKEKKARATAEEVATFMRVVFAGEGTYGEAGRNRDFNKKRTVKEAMDDATKTIEGKFGDRPEVEAEVRNTIGRTYYELVESHLVSCRRGGRPE